MNFLKRIKGFKKITIFLFGALTVYLEDTIGLTRAAVDSIIQLCSIAFLGFGIPDAAENFSNFFKK